MVTKKREKGNRHLTIQATEKGKESFTPSVIENRFKAIFSVLTAEEKNHLDAILKKILENECEKLNIVSKIFS